MAPTKWQKFERGIVSTMPYYLEDSDNCFFARDYASGKGFQHSETNQLISNLKKSPKHRGASHWHYKGAAIRRFAAELGALIQNAKGAKIYIAPIPSSKRPDHPEYDDRLVQVTRLVATSSPNCLVTEPVVRSVDCDPCHLSVAKRPKPDQVFETLRWNGELADPSTPVLFVDDVITTGCTFKQCQRMIHLHNPGREVYGVFWARTVWDELSEAG
ncbi:hypothetical protein [Limnoglobus roseus]|uniref:ComF family protein n=1 Tax=Limnoglobus roseus TaxID=2598579 RepID=A0A5C1ASF8_9BACT|nr:hypothetical protein [Limnoglobus roseus]QEL19838.1 hypothetical protein PX52LOC_06919 [Limnoglobus roseus]